jgi:uncharacterized LabA/DUF88 family protein
VSKAKVAVLIDGGYTRKLAQREQIPYNPDYIEKIARACVSEDETALRYLYYDCAPYRGTVKLPVSGQDHTFDKPDAWLHALAKKDLFAIRRGVLKFRGWNPKTIPVQPKVMTDKDFTPNFEQKGVDMRIGLDVATYSTSRLVDRLILVSGDTDCIPAMKLARINGVQIVLVTFPKRSVSGELLAHCDFCREVLWPKP